MSLLAVLVTLPIGDFIEKLPRSKQQVPQAYEESMRLPGKPPASSQDLHGTWELEYSEVGVNVDDFTVDLLVKMVLQFNEDGTYQLQYAGRWGNPPLRGKDARGLTVDETGTFKLSSDVLILDPVEVTKTDVVKKDAAGTLGLANEKHLFVVHWETRRIHLAGKCASYQLDPVCKDWRTANVWFTFKGPNGRKLRRRN